MSPDSPDAEQLLRPLEHQESPPLSLPLDIKIQLLIHFTARLSPHLAAPTFEARQQPTVATPIFPLSSTAASIADTSPKSDALGGVSQHRVELQPLRASELNHVDKWNTHTWEVTAPPSPCSP
jgi:hypothetical protein